ncbi:TRAP transporter large permease [Ammoniphilus resinae]|uniref:C4-dicarboxylate transporter DctM subunit n=1 Tax=Ammoniphilus resinae TaxID=861532 RepID=A0ABS4GMD1_9BACL|nr:TRAP transporter large permease [Ammoniphilus resinae]MBP1931409.1 C4-dicarboxylate transporter DctM subunit [Ammoniphilus resinae]
MAILMLFGSFILLMLINVPIAFALGISSILTLWATQKMPLVIIAQGMFSTIDTYALLAVPLFIFAGVLMEFGGMSRRLINVAKSLVGHYTGGLAAVSILACTFFAALSGSGPATVAAIGGIMIPAMVKEKYDAGYSSAVVASAGTLGIIIPPSIPLVIYGVITSTSIESLFMAGVIPGLLLAIVLWGLSYVMAKKRGYTGSNQKIDWKEVRQFLSEAKLTLFMPVVVLGGIYGGIFTPTEAAGVAVAYSALLGFFVYKEIKMKDLLELFKRATLISGTILIIIGTASTYGRILVLEKVPVTIAEFLTTLTDQRWIILTLILLFLVFVGMFMETLSAIILLAPILLPVATHFGIDPVHFGIIMILASEIGFLTPPVGDSLNVACAISGLSFEEVTVATLPFTIAMIGMLFIIAFFPTLSLIVPNLLK